MGILTSLFHICVIALIILPFVVVAIVQKDKRERDKERWKYQQRRR